MLAVTFGSPAGAATVYDTFYSGGSGYTGPYSGASGPATVYSSTKSMSTTCPTGNPGCGSADILGTSLGFTGGLTATVNGPSPPNQVWDDLQPHFGGLGVGTGSNDDNINGSDILKLTFSTSVTLTGVGTLFTDGHAPFGTYPNFQTAAQVAAQANTIDFMLSLDGVSWQRVSFLSANDMLLSLVGTTFYFEQDTTNPNGHGGFVPEPTYYVSGLSYLTCGGPEGCAPPPSGTPLPGALPLFASGLGALGLLGWRRKRKNAATAA
jgi:hypothetical protein